MASESTLEDATGTSKDNLTRDLEEMASTSEVDQQMAALRAELGEAPEKNEIAGGAGTPSVDSGETKPISGETT